MTKSTVWIMDDEESILDVLELYQEARAVIDETYPRGAEQVAFIGTLAWERWHEAHNVMFGLLWEVQDDC